MSIPWSEEKIRALRAALDQMEDAQATGPDEYVWICISESHR